MSSINKRTMREVARDLTPSWSNEQFDAHWEEFIVLKKSVLRGRRKHSNRPTEEREKENKA